MKQLLFVSGFFCLLFFLPRVKCDFYMIVEYDTNGTARPTSLAVSISTVELYVTVLGCDHGYYISEKTSPSLVCTECICTDFSQGREEAFVGDIG